MAELATLQKPEERASEEPEKSKTRGFRLFGTAVAAIAGFLYGYDTGIISGALLHIRQDFKLFHQMQETTASAILVGAVIGALACGWLFELFERLGRRRMLMLVAFIFATGSLASSIAPSATLLVCARVLLGFAVGGASQTGPVYVAELVPADRRGHFATSFNVAIGLGILTANIVGFSLNNVWSWR
ncbi:MAG: MFS transporter [Bryobacteraceae bacterium]